VALFIVFPRVGLSLLLLNRPKSGRMIGFSGKVDLGQIGTLRTDPTIALRVVYPDLENPPARKVMHLRGTALDRYDGHSWTQSSATHRTIATGGDLVAFGTSPIDRDNRITIELEPIDPPVLFFPPETAGLRLRQAGVGPGATVSIQRGPEGEFRYQAPGDRGVHYTAFLSDENRPSFVALRQAERYRYLQLPELPERIRDLAKGWTDDAKSDLRKAQAIERHLRTEFSYDLSSPSGAEDEPLDHFLFESRRGHCEYYSTAMAVMLRTVRIPSRNVTGFVGGTARQVARHGVTINNLLPGSHATDRIAALEGALARSLNISVEAAGEKRRSEIPAQRYGTTAEFGAACAFICSAHAGFMVGQNVLLDGGQTNVTI
jgi:hypothetical protein